MKNETLKVFSLEELIGENTSDITQITKTCEKNLKDTVSEGFYGIKLNLKMRDLKDNAEFQSANVSDIKYSIKIAQMCSCIELTHGNFTRFLKIR